MEAPQTELLSTMSTIVPAMSLGVVTVMAATSVYRKVRRRFSKAVNCWFCNQNTKVPYDEANSWHCPSCEQYNGFDDDGDYNCDIPAQRCKATGSPSINHNDTKSSVGSPANGRYTNGLCRDCNRNQTLKVQQITAFQATSEANYDREFDAYKKRLEETYRLCGRCERTLKRTLYAVKKDILGAKLSEKKLFRRPNIMESPSKMSLAKKLRIVFTHLGVFLLLAISLFNVVRYSMTIEVTKRNLDTLLHPKLVHVFLVILTYIKTIQSLVVGEKFLDISKTLQDFYVDDQSGGESSYYLGTLMFAGQILNLGAVVLVLLMLAVNRSTNLRMIAILLMFSVQLSFSPNDFHSDFLIDSINCITAFSAFVITTWGSASIKSICDDNKGKGFNNSFRKMYDTSLEEESDEEDLTDTEEDSELDSLFNKSQCFSSKTINDEFQNRLSIDGRAQQFRPIPQRANIVSNNPFSSFAERERPLPTPTQFAQRPGIDRFHQVQPSLSELHRRHTNGHLSPVQQKASPPLMFQISPTQLHHQQTSPKSLFMRQQHSPQSWVAGGFWNQCQAAVSEPALDFVPQMSRTSSQSSGFEGSLFGDFDRMSEPAPTYAMKRGTLPPLQQQQKFFNQTRFNGFPPIQKGDLLRNAVNKLGSINEINR